MSFRFLSVHLRLPSDTRSHSPFTYTSTSKCGWQTGKKQQTEECASTGVLPKPLPLELSLQKTTMSAWQVKTQNVEPLDTDMLSCMTRYLMPHFDFRWCLRSMSFCFKMNHESPTEGPIFSQMHGNTFVPLSTINPVSVRGLEGTIPASRQQRYSALFRVYNSPLSEAAALAFEYGASGSHERVRVALSSVSSYNV